ncbi:MAG: cupin domain-containing protein [Balneolaceae bacterium]|nr:cupin domain-containing protein [Balneolaceae bacterium]
MSKVLKCNNYQWQGVDRKDYKSATSCYKGVHRYSLLGEREDEQELNFQTRYFEVEEGGYTSLEFHQHPHSVVVIRGGGMMVLDNNIYELSLHDVVYISPGTLHQFHADANKKLGFICVVDRYRDRPTLPDEDYLDERVANPEVKKKIRK